MATVFGMEQVPVFEMLFVMFLLLLIGLVVVLLELRRLSKLITQEKTDIKRFELDLAQFEKDQGKKPSTELVNYVNEAVSKGMPEDKIESGLADAGWNRKEIKDIFDQLKSKQI